METLGRALKMESKSNQDIWWHKMKPNSNMMLGENAWFTKRPILVVLQDNCTYFMYSHVHVHVRQT